jgi:carbon dioxide concentrating mechanism protein CcmM
MLPKRLTPKTYNLTFTQIFPNVTFPRISNTAYVDPLSVVIGDCEIGRLVLIAPFAVCRGDEGTPIHIGNYSNVQDVVFYILLKQQITDRILMTEDILS